MISEFQAQTEQGVGQGLVGFIAYGNRTYQVIGYTPAPVYGEYGAGMEATIRSFGPVSDPAILNVQPLRVDIVQAPGPITVEEFARRFESAVPPATLAVSITCQVPTPDCRRGRSSNKWWERPSIAAGRPIADRRQLAASA